VPEPVIADAGAWISLGVSLVALCVALYFSIRSDRRSGRALALAEADHAERERERGTRAQLRIAIDRLFPPIDDRGVVRVGPGPGRYVRFRIVVRNEGDRDAGPTNVQVTTPVALGGIDSQWTNAAGDDRPFSDHAPRRIPSERNHLRMLGTVNVLTRRLDAVTRSVPEELYFRVAVADPPAGVVDRYTIEVSALAEGAAETSEASYPLRIGAA
jgi:hypothetical protein